LLGQYGAADSTKEFFMDNSLWKTNDIALHSISYFGTQIPIDDVA
jgi:hypothetical protein